MRKHLGLLLIASPLLAVTSWRPVPNTGVCFITAVSGATPAVVTVNSATLCGMSTGVDTKIAVWGARNTNTLMSDINSHAGSSLSDTNHLVRTAKNVNTSTNTFSVYAADGTTAIAGGGTWSFFGLVWRVESATVRDLNIMWNGDNISRITATDSTGMWNASRPEVIAMKASSVAHHASARFEERGYDRFALLACAEAIEWKAGGDTTRRDYAKWWANNEKPFQAVATSMNMSGSEMHDYRMTTQSVYYACLINTIYADLSAGEKTALLEYLFNDLPGSKGGVGVSGATPTVPAARSVSGNVSCSGTTCTCTTTCDFSNITVGDIASLPAGNVCGYAPMFPIASKTGNTSFTITTPYYGIDCGAMTNKAFSVSPAWATGGVGRAWMQHYVTNSADMLCGVSVFRSSNDPQTMCPWYNKGTADWSYFSGQSQYMGWHNHVIGTVMTWMGLGHAMAQSGNSSALLVQILADGLFYHVTYPVVRSNWMGTAAGSESYHKLRMGRDIPMMCGWMKSLWSDDQEYCDDKVYEQFALWNMTTIPGQATFLPGINEGSFVGAGTGAGPEFIAPGFTATWAKPSLATAGQFRYWANNTWGSGSQITSSLYLSGGLLREGFLTAFFGNDLAITASARTNTTFPFTYNYQSDCLLRYSSGGCQNIPKYAMASLVGNRLGYAKCFSWRLDDHYGQPNECDLQLFANNRTLMGSDAVGLIAGPTSASNLAIGGTTNWKTVYNTSGVTVLDRSYASAELAYFAVDSTDHYLAGAAVSSVKRRWYHLKALATDVWFEAIKVDTTTSKVVDWYGSFYTYTVGGASSDTTTAFDSMAKTFTGTKTGNAAKIASVFEGGTVSGGAGTRAYKVTQEATAANSTTMSRAHMVTPDATATVPTITHTTSGSHDAYTVDVASVHYLVMEAFGTSNLTSCSFTVANANTAVVCTGIAPGTYNFKLGGVNISGCTSQVVVAPEYVAKCNDVDAGSMTLVAGVVQPLVVNTSSLEAGTVNGAYSQALDASGGETPFVWSLISGTMCAGLALNSDGTITGTPTTPQTCSFTVQVDSDDDQTATKALQISIAPEPPPGTGGKLKGQAAATGQTRVQ